MSRFANPNRKNPGPRILRAVAAIGVLVLGTTWVSLGTEVELEPLVPYHSDAAAAEAGAAEAFGGFLRGDPARVQSGLEKIAGSTRLLRSEEKENYGSIVAYSQSFEITLNLAREYAYAGELEKSYEQAVWSQKACVTCHDAARGRNLMPRP